MMRARCSMTAMVKVPSPVDPTADKREEHSLAGHAVYRSWCQHCLRGRCREWPHHSSTSSSDQHGLLIISFDYGYLCQKDNSLEGESEAE